MASEGKLRWRICMATVVKNDNAKTLKSFQSTCQIQSYLVSWQYTYSLSWKGENATFWSESDRSATAQKTSEALLFAIRWWGLSLESIRSPLFSTTGMQSYFSYSQPTLLSLWQLRSLEISEKLKELEAGANERLHFLYQKVCMRLKPISFSNFVYYSKRTQNRFENCFLAKKKQNELFPVFVAEKTVPSLNFYWKQRVLNDVSHLYGYGLKRQFQTHTFLLPDRYLFGKKNSILWVLNK